MIAIQRTFAPRKKRDGPVTFAVGLVSRAMPGPGSHAQGESRIVARRLDRPLKSLIPHRGRAGAERFDIRQDVTDFITSRVGHGNDAARWKVVLDRDAREFGVYLKGVAINGDLFVKRD